MLGRTLGTSRLALEFFMKVRGEEYPARDCWMLLAPNWDFGLYSAERIYSCKIPLISLSITSAPADGEISPVRTRVKFGEIACEFMRGHSGITG